MPKELVMSTKQTLDEYTQLVDTKLKPNLSKAMVATDAVRQELEDFSALHNRLSQWDDESKESSPLNEKANLGHEQVYCDVQVDDPRTLFVSVGYGFHVEMTRDEALEFTKRRVEHLLVKLNRSQANVDKLSSHLASVQRILDQLDNLESR